ncbi:MAG: SusC/RagA family protein, partial [Prevotellaceae bacterium]|nr:SusC/RagA family protein [Prevotellaceae bacterium]
IINANDMYMTHHAAPDYTLSFSSRFTYKKFDLGFSLRANIGNYVYNDVLADQMRNVPKNNHYSSKYGGFMNLTTLAYNTYQKGFKVDKISDNTYMTDFYIEDASFLRCDNITLGYTFGNISKLNIRCRVYATVQNPFVITGYTGLDPETDDGIDNNIYPRSMVTLVGLNLSF